MKAIYKRISAAFICILILVLSATNIASSAAPAAEQGSGSITVIIDNVAADFPSVEYSLYRIATVSDKNVISLCGEFSNLKISFENINSENLRILSTTLKGYAAANDIKPDKTAFSDEQGHVLFDGLDNALYLIVGKTVHYGDSYITPTPAIVVLPETDAKTGEEINNIVLHEKSTVEKDNKTKDIQVLKVWKNATATQRPPQITVELYNGNRLYDTAVLNKDNNWQAEWKNLSGSDWHVIEKDIPDGFVVTIDQQSTRFVITNTKTGKHEDEITTVIPEESATNKSETTTTPEETTTVPENPPRLPQTGQLWWPVLVCTCLGIMFIIFGIVNRKYEEDAKI
jgi:hypothetical protein